MCSYLEALLERHLPQTARSPSSCSLLITRRGSSAVAATQKASSSKRFDVGHLAGAKDHAATTRFYENTDSEDVKADDVPPRPIQSRYKRVCRHVGTCAVRQHFACGAMPQGNEANFGSLRQHLFCYVHTQPTHRPQHLCSTFLVIITMKRMQH